MADEPSLARIGLDPLSFLACWRGRTEVKIGGAGRVCAVAMTRGFWI